MQGDKFHQVSRHVFQKTKPKKTKKQSRILKPFSKKNLGWRRESVALCSERGVEAVIINTEVCIIMALKNGQSLQSTNYNHFHLPLLPFEFTFTRQLYWLQRKHFALLEYSGGTSCETIPHFSCNSEKSYAPSGDCFGFVFYIL